MKNIYYIILFVNIYCSSLAQKIPTISISKSDMTSLTMTDKLKESSGLIFWNKQLWSHNDDVDTQLYGLNTATGLIEKTWKIEGLEITDWEEIQHDSTYLYIGDFGNNFKGNRKNLRILRVHKVTHKIEAIEFHYPEQSNFLVQKPNTTNFDCEAFLVSDSIIYLFTKEWDSGAVTLYKLPNKMGKHSAKKIKEIRVNGLITGATFNFNRDKIVLSAYSKTLTPYLFLLEDFANDHFFDGKLTRLQLPKTFLQIEAVTFINENTIAITNEAFKHTLINSIQQINLINLLPYLNK